MKVTNLNQLRCVCKGPYIEIMIIISKIHDLLDVVLQVFVNVKCTNVLYYK